MKLLNRHALFLWEERGPPRLFPGGTDSSSHGGASAGETKGTTSWLTQADTRRDTMVAAECESRSLPITVSPSFLTAPSPSPACPPSHPQNLDHPPPPLLPITQECGLMLVRLERRMTVHSHRRRHPEDRRDTGVRSRVLAKTKFTIVNRGWQR